MNLLLSILYFFGLRKRPVNKKINYAIDALKIRTREEIDAAIASGEQKPDYVYAPLTPEQMTALSEKVRTQSSQIPDYFHNLTRKYQK